MSKEIMYEYYGYGVVKSGKIYDAFGDEVPLMKNGTVRITLLDGQMHCLSAGKIVYEAITKTDLGRKYVVKYKDGNKLNPAFDNIEVISRKEYFKDHEWNGRLSKEEREELCNSYYIKRPTFTELALQYNTTSEAIQDILFSKGGKIKLRKIAAKYKISDEDVSSIYKTLTEKPPTYVELSKKYNISLALVEKILRKYRKEHGIVGRKDKYSLSYQEK